MIPPSNFNDEISSLRKCIKEHLEKEAALIVDKAINDILERVKIFTTTRNLGNDRVEWFVEVKGDK